MKLTPENGILFVDHRANRRSGHLGHALVEYGEGRILAFYSNCAGSRHHGHSGFGWMEYKRSLDYGATWSEPFVLPYSYEAFLDGLFTVSCEKAVCTADGTIVVCCLRNECKPAWEPWLTPMVITSKDGGETWSEAKEMSPEAGRVYDMRMADGVIYALHFANDAQVSFCGSRPEHRYLLLESTDHGRSFHEKSVVPFDALGRGYGALVITPDKRMLAYVYNSQDEFHMDVCESADMGQTWQRMPASFAAKRIRNPQISYLDGTYYLHGRSGCMDDKLPMEFVLYTSPDALHWDEGTYIYKTPAGASGGASYYSNNLLVHTPRGNRLLIQSSAAYEDARTDIRQWWIDPD